ncbi:MAG: peptidase S8 [Bacteroidetes bacterium]|nr:peptidase S8 [Bacteroidota bacterium]
MKRFSSFFLFVLLILPGVFIQAQSGDGLANILRETNVNALISLSYELKTESEQNKSTAWQLAPIRGWITRHELADGTIMELMGIDDNGNPMYYTTTNQNSVKSISTDKVYNNGGFGLNLTGTGMVLREWDGGAVRTTHQELTGRVTQVDGATSQSDHSTHVAGTMIASGVQAAARGMAYQATLRAFEWTNDLSEMASEAALGALISNHSYGYICGWYFNGFSWSWYGDPTISNVEDYKFGYYDDQARKVDSIAVLSPYYLVCKSSGNDRGNYNGSGPQEPDGGADGFDCVGSMGNAKNILTVGAVNDITTGYRSPADVVMSSFSSWGPTDDGRIKPDLLANGIGLYSCFKANNTAYGTYSGTSMSTPSISGALILLQQHHNALYGSYIRAATLKALAIHTADEAGNANGPDYVHGWGLMNTAKAADAITQKNVSAIIQEIVLNNGSTYTLNVNATGNQLLKVTIAWTDPKGNSPPKSLNPATLILVNDLDLRIDGTNQPWRLNPASPSSDATTGDNFRDNVEQVIMTNPSSGNHTITVTHKGSLQGGSQAFSIIVTGIYTGVAYPSPFTATPISDTRIDLAWMKNTSNDQVVIAWTNTGVFGTPVNGTSYGIGSTIPGGGTVIYNGSGSLFQHSSLTANTSYHYMIWSYNGSNTYSVGRRTSGTTFCTIINTFPYSESFATSSLPSCWVIQPAGIGTSVEWIVNNSSNAGGTAYEMRCAYQNLNPASTRLILPPIKTIGMTNLSLSFRHLLDDYGVGATLKVQSSPDGSNWTDEGWSMATASNSNKGPYLVDVPITHNLDLSATRIAFVITGNLYQYDYWYIDNVVLKSSGFWVGGTSGFPNDWNTASNWGDGFVPTTTTDAIITPRNSLPVVNNDVSSPAFCRDLIIHDGATLTVNPGKKLEINGYLQILGTGGLK